MQEIMINKWIWNVGMAQFLEKRPVRALNKAGVMPNLNQTHFLVELI